MRTRIKDYLLVIAGTTLTALAFGALILPAGVLAGGVTGCARILGAASGLPVSGVVLLLNAGLFAAGYFFAGRVFVMRSAVSTFYFPLALELAQRLPELQSIPIPAASVAAGVMIGVGSAMVICGKGSQGGFDVVAVILNKKCGVPIAYVVNGIDAAIILLQVFHAAAAHILGGLLLIAASGVTMNALLVRQRTLSKAG